VAFAEVIDEAAAVDVAVRPPELTAGVAVGIETPLVRFKVCPYLDLPI